MHVLVEEQGFCQEAQIYWISGKIILSLLRKSNRTCFSHDRETAWRSVKSALAFTARGTSSPPPIPAQSNSLPTATTIASPSPQTTPRQSTTSPSP
jgi:hypothetical protein